MAEGIVGKRLAEEAFTRHNIHRKVVSKVVSAVKGGTKRATAKAIVSAMWEDNADMGDIVEALEKQRFTRRTIYNMIGSKTGRSRHANSCSDDIEI